jgi:hypothetical protein
MPKLPSPATLLLNRADVTVPQVAQDAGVAQPSVAAQLAGRRPLQEKTLRAIRSLAGPATAEEIADEAARARCAYLLEVQAGRM